MKKYISFILRFVRKATYFDLLMVFSFVVVAIAALLVFFQKTTFVTVRMRLTQTDVIYVSGNPPAWFAYMFKPGMKSADYLGRTSAEITDVVHYESLGLPSDDLINRRVVYLTIRLRSSYNNRTHEYKYKGSVLAAGEMLRINFGGVAAQGLIIDTENIPNPYETVEKTVRARIQEGSVLFPGVTGVDQYVVDAISVGDAVLDSRGQTVAKVLSKESGPALSVSVDNQGGPRTYTHPRRKDLFLTLLLTTKKVGNELYYFDDFFVKIGALIPLNFPKITIRALITEIPDSPNGQ